MMSELKAWCMKTKQKEEMLDITVTKNKIGRFQVKGTSKDGHKMSLFIAESKATELIAEGAKKDF